MGLFRTRLCVYCKLPVTFWDLLTGNWYEADYGGPLVHAKCKIEPKVGE